MKIYSNTLTREDLYRTFDETVGFESGYVDEYRHFTPRGPFAHGYEVFAGSWREHGHARNGRPGKALTWDEYGIWMEALYALDPEARIAWYESREDFLAKTAQYQPRGMKAPWLDRTPVSFADAIDTVRVDSLTNDEVDAALYALRNV